MSEANVKQRKGRAGRVQPGESFHMFTKDKFNNLDPFPTPEIFRVPLEKSVLDCKVSKLFVVVEQFRNNPLLSIILKGY